MIIGASSGIGLAIARRLKREAFIVTGISRRTPPPDAVDEAVCCDILDAEALTGALQLLSRKHGVPKALIYSAGYPVMGKAFSIPLEEARKAFDVNFWGLDCAMRTVIPEMRDHGGGTILAVLSIAALCPPAFESYYSASKAAAAAYLRALDLENNPYNIRIRWLAPGYIDTGFLERGNWFGMSVPKVRGSGITPEQIAQAALEMIHRGPRHQNYGMERALPRNCRATIPRPRQALVQA